jgi:hypothetical protein
MLEELAREATLADVSILVDGNGAELHGNSAVLKGVEVPQVREV